MRWRQGKEIDWREGDDHSCGGARIVYTEETATCAGCGSWWELPDVEEVLDL